MAAWNSTYAYDPRDQKVAGMNIWQQPDPATGKMRWFVSKDSVLDPNHPLAGAFGAGDRLGAEVSIPWDDLDWTNHIARTQELGGGIDASNWQNYYGGRERVEPQWNPETNQWESPSVLPGGATGPGSMVSGYYMDSLPIRPGQLDANKLGLWVGNEDRNFWGTYGPLIAGMILTGGAAGGAFGGTAATEGVLAGGAGAFEAGGLGAAEAMGLGAGYSSPAIAGSGGLIEGLTNTEALAYIKDAADPIDALIRMSEITPNGTAATGAQALGAQSPELLLKSINPSWVNSGSNWFSDLLNKKPPTPPTGTGGDGGGTPTPGGGQPAPTMTDKLKNWLAQSAVSTAVTSALSPRTKAVDNSELMRQLAASEDANMRAGAQAVNDAFAGYDDKYYTGIADAYKNYATPMMDEQATEARRVLPFGFSSSAGSAYQRKSGQLERDITRGYADIGNEGINQANQRRGAVENTKNELLGLVQSGVNSETAAGEAAAQAQQYAAPPPFSPLADLFSKYTADAANYSIARANLGNGGGAAGMGGGLLFNRGAKNAQRIVA